MRTEPWNVELDEVVGTWPSDDELVGWFSEGVERLAVTLETADPDVACWSFLRAPTPLTMWARRQAHETAIHRVDGELAAGDVSPFAPAFAADGLDELLTAFIVRRKTNLVADPPRSLRVTTLDADGDWTVHIGPDGVRTSRGADPDGDAECSVRGRASDLYLSLWNRRAPAASTSPAPATCSSCSSIGCTSAGDGAASVPVAIPATVRPVRTRLTELLDIEHPIMLAGMGGVSYHRLVAAVSDAGGIGTLGASTMAPAELPEEMAKVRALTAKPFGVDLLTALPGQVETGIADVIAGGAHIFVAGLGVPREVIDALHDANILVGSMCGKVRHAIGAVASGCDFVVAQGTEAGGHTGHRGDHGARSAGRRRRR